MTVFETETMAELCVKQALVTEALAIYRRLVADARDEAVRSRYAARLAELQRMAKTVAETRGAASAVPAPAAAAGDPSFTVEHRADMLVLTWSLPPETRTPAIQLLLLRRGAEGIEAETRTLQLEATQGTMTVEARDLHSVRAAVGWLDGDRFVPLVRLGAQGP